ncbi:hypothetical protein Q6247_27145, partial [Klebsiella pneumoniae]
MDYEQIIVHINALLAPYPCNDKCEKKNILLIQVLTQLNPNHNNGTQISKGGTCSRNIDLAAASRNTITA